MGRLFLLTGHASFNTRRETQGCFDLGFHSREATAARSLGRAPSLAAQNKQRPSTSTKTTFNFSPDIRISKFHSFVPQELCDLLEEVLDIQSLVFRHVYFIHRRSHQRQPAISRGQINPKRRMPHS